MLTLDTRDHEDYDNERLDEDKSSVTAASKSEETIEHTVQVSVEDDLKESCTTYEEFKTTLFDSRLLPYKRSSLPLPTS